MMKPVRCVLLAFLFLPAGLQAQTGIVSGTVTAVSDGAPVAAAQLRLRSSSGRSIQALSDQNGRFQVTVGVGSYSLSAWRIGYEVAYVEPVDVVAGTPTVLAVRLMPVVLILDPLVISPSRREERALQAPTAVSSVREEAIDARVATNIADHVLAVPGVDAAETGMMRTSLVTRGFNDVFSTSLLVLTDGRFTGLPSNRLNALYMIPTTDLDVERVEVSLGPASALYGPNATNGVMHLITKSPIDRPGTSLLMSGGERGTYQGMFRSAWAAPSGKFGAKLSGQYFSGDDWKWVDPEETAAALNPANPLIGAAVYKAERWSAEVRADYRPSASSELSFAAGSNTTLKQVEVSGAGRSMADGWRNSFVQSRLTHGQLVARAYVNFSDAGDSYQLRTGLPFVDKSRMWVGQLQHSARAFGSDLTYGIDVQRTDTRSGGTITGRYETDDRVDEAGAYVQALTHLTQRLQAVGALRVDAHNRLDEPVWSPRLGLIYRPAEGHTVRATFNRAFRTPSVLEQFLDIKAGVIPIAPGFEYDLRAVGPGERGFSFDQCEGGGVGGFCMRVPGLGATQLPADATLLWDQFIQAVAPALAPLLPRPVGEVSSVLRRLDPSGLATGNPFPLDLNGPSAVEPLRPRIDNTIEVGYKGLIRGKLLISGNIYYQKIRDFVGPVGVETPNVFLDPVTTSAYVNNRLRPLVTGGQMSQQDVDALITALVSIPMGTVTPSEWDAADILFSYRNVGNVELWGSEGAADFVVNPTLTLGGSVSWSSKDCFDLDHDGACSSAIDRAMNAPRWKGHVHAQLASVSAGLSGQTRLRFISGFPQSAGVFVGDVDGYTVMDASVAYRVRQMPRVSLVLTASNLLGTLHRPMIGAPEIGRLTMLRLRYDH